MSPSNPFDRTPRDSPKEYPALAGLVEVRLTVERMRHQILQCLTDMTGTLAATVRAEVEKAIANFDIEAEIRRAANSCIAEQIRGLTNGVVYEAMRDPVIVERVEAMAAKAVRDDMERRATR